MRARLTKTTALAAVGALGALLATNLAGAEVIQNDNIVVAFHGGISPRKLPRTGTAPVGVQVGGKIKTTDSSEPPKLARIVLEINRHGTLQNAGLPDCSLQKLESISSTGALRACGDALVGHGNVTSRITLPENGTFASNGKLLAFNGRYHGHTAIFAQVSSGAPLPLTYVIVFEVKRQSGTFATSLVATVPAIASEYGYISAFDLSLKRRYTHDGKRLSYASAGCPAPAGLPGAVFPFAVARYEFDDGHRLESKLVRKCNVRGR
jgi:hypothetical protein